MNDLPAHSDVVIIGAGPVGLTLAATLTAQGVRPVVFDRLAEGENTSRAAVVHARTLEVLEKLGVSEALCDQGVKVPRFAVRERDRTLLTIQFDNLPTRYPFTLMVPQSTTEAVLLRRLLELGGEVQWSRTATAVEQDAGGVNVAVATDGAGTGTIRARYVVGADGMHSLVREQAGIGFAGGTYSESFVLADVRLAWGLPADEVMLFFSPDGLVVIAPLPGGRHRIVATLEPAPEHPTVSDMQRLLDARGPADSPARIEAMVWSSRFRVHHRVADRFWSGRIVLAGDAAHVHSPAGGQGMNTGIQDAVALGGVLVAVLSGAPEESALEEYERRRRAVARRVVALTDRLTRVATLRAPSARAVRNVALRSLGRLPAFRRNLAAELAELHYR